MRQQPALFSTGGRFNALAVREHTTAAGGARNINIVDADTIPELLHH